jgi:hypothetical protein
LEEALVDCTTSDCFSDRFEELETKYGAIHTYIERLKSEGLDNKSNSLKDDYIDLKNDYLSAAKEIFTSLLNATAIESLDGIITDQTMFEIAEQLKESLAAIESKIIQPQDKEFEMLENNYYTMGSWNYKERFSLYKDIYIFEEKKYELNSFLELSGKFQNLVRDYNDVVNKLDILSSEIKSGALENQLQVLKGIKSDKLNDLKISSVQRDIEKDIKDSDMYIISKDCEKEFNELVIKIDIPNIHSPAICKNLLSSYSLLGEGQQGYGKLKFIIDKYINGYKSFWDSNLEGVIKSEALSDAQEMFDNKEKLNNVDDIEIAGKLERYEKIWDRCIFGDEFTRVMTESSNSNQKRPYFERYLERIVKNWAKLVGYDSTKAMKEILQLERGEIGDYFYTKYTSSVSEIYLQQFPIECFKLLKEDYLEKRKSFLKNIKNELSNCFPFSKDINDSDYTSEKNKEIKNKWKEIYVKNKYEEGQIGGGFLVGIKKVDEMLKEIIEPDKDEDVLKITDMLNVIPNQGLRYQCKVELLEGEGNNPASKEFPYLIVPGRMKTNVDFYSIRYPDNIEWEMEFPSEDSLILEFYKHTPKDNADKHYKEYKAPWAVFRLLYSGLPSVEKQADGIYSVRVYPFEEEGFSTTPNCYITLKLTFKDNDGKSIEIPLN